MKRQKTRPDFRHANPGRPPLVEGEATRRITIRVNDSLADKVERNGGSPWIRELIAKAREAAS